MPFGGNIARGFVMRLCESGIPAMYGSSVSLAIADDICGEPGGSARIKQLHHLCRTKEGQGRVVEGDSGRGHHNLTIIRGIGLTGRGLEPIILSLDLTLIQFTRRRRPRSRWRPCRCRCMPPRGFAS